MKIDWIWVALSALVWTTFPSSTQARCFEKNFPQVCTTSDGCPGERDCVGGLPTKCIKDDPTGCPVAQLITQQLQVSRFNTSALTNADADRILTDATNVLQTNDGPGDVNCKVAFSRNGNVTAFTTGDGSIDSQAEFNTVIGLGGDVKVVNAINWCGALIPNVIGCSPVPGNSLAVVRFTNTQEGILWAHEYGHTKGRNHRNDDTNAVMNGTIADNRRRINSNECTAYRN